MPNVVNQMILRELTDAVGRAEGLVVVSVGGLSVTQTEVVRRQLREKRVRMRLVRSRLARRVCAERKLSLPAEAFDGSVALVSGSAEDAINAAKVFTSPEVKKVGKLAIRGGVLEGRVLGPADTAALADVPDRKTLQAQLVGLLAAPARSLVTVLDASPSGLARVIQGRADRQASDAGAAAAAPAGEAAGG
jgi:large subunit ribosomal protein L10